MSNAVKIYLKKLINESTVLLEAKDRRNKILAMGLNQTWADFFHTISNKNSDILAKIFIKECIDKLPIWWNTTADKNLKTFISLLNKSVEIGYPPELREINTKFSELRDFFNYYDNQNEVSYELKNKTLSDLTQLSDDWHAGLKGDSEESKHVINRTDETPETVRFITYPNGWYWINLNCQTSKDEASNMGHCGNDTGKILFSLRDKNNNSRITASYDTSNNALHQIKGRANSRPKAEYHPYIVDLLLNDEYPIKSKVDTSFRPDLDFHLSDLNNDQIQKILEVRPRLITDMDVNSDAFKIVPIKNKLQIIVHKLNFQPDEYKIIGDKIQVQQSIGWTFKQIIKKRYDVESFSQYFDWSNMTIVHYCEIVNDCKLEPALQLLNMTIEEFMTVMNNFDDRTINANIKEIYDSSPDYYEFIEVFRKIVGGKYYLISNLIYYFIPSRNKRRNLEYKYLNNTQLNYALNTPAIRDQVLNVSMKFIQACAKKPIRYFGLTLFDNSDNTLNVIKFLKSNMEYLKYFDDATIFTQVISDIKALDKYLKTIKTEYDLKYVPEMYMTKAGFQKAFLTMYPKRYDEIIDFVSDSEVKKIIKTIQQQKNATSVVNKKK